jgi:SAM-dependent methyltransferase
VKLGDPEALTERMEKRSRNEGLKNKIAERAYKDVTGAYLRKNKEYRLNSHGNDDEDGYVLDIGAGEFPRGDVALDVSPPRNRVAVDYVVGDACHLPFRSNVFHKVLSYGALNYFSSDVKLFEEVARVLKKGHLFVVSVYT